MLELHIDEVYPKGKTYPMIVHFQNGYPKENFTEHKCVVLENKTSLKKTVATEINNLVYRGEECEEEVGKTLLLARNRVTGKVRLIEVGIVELQPEIEKDVEDKNAQETSYIELGRKFGSKKHKQMLDQKEKLKVSEDVVMEQLQNVSQNISLDQLDLSAYNKSDMDDFYIPPINREATDVADIYRFDEILTQDQYNTIYSELDGTEYMEDLFPCIKEILSHNWSLKQTVLAVYASSLLMMNMKLAREISVKSFLACPYSATLNNHILSQFLVPCKTRGTRGRPTQYKDKALCHAIVFIYLINNYKVDMECLWKHTKIMERNAVLKINLTGGWTVKEGKKKIGVLKLPLNKASGRMTRRKSVMP